MVTFSVHYENSCCSEIQPKVKEKPNKKVYAQKCDGIAPKFF